MSTKDSDISIRRMMRNDIEVVLDLNKKISENKNPISYRDLVSIDPGGPLDFSCVGEYGGKVVGFILARLQYTGIPLVATCIIESIATDPEYQKQGIGGKMVNNLLDRCYAEGIPKTRADIHEDDIELINFFQELSFKPSQIINYDFDVVSEYLPSR